MQTNLNAPLHPCDTRAARRAAPPPSAGYSGQWPPVWGLWEAWEAVMKASVLILPLLMTVQLEVIVNAAWILDD